MIDGMTLRLLYLSQLRLLLKTPSFNGLLYWIRILIHIEVWSTGRPYLKTCQILEECGREDILKTCKIVGGQPKSICVASTSLHGHICWYG
jgi:hypothetical protein